MAKRYVRRGAFVVAGLLLGLGSAVVAQELSENALSQIRAIYADKATWTPAQSKLDTSLLYAGRESRGLAMVQGLGPLRRVADRARVDGQGMAVVDIRADVTDGLLQTIADLGGRVASAFPAFGAVRARVPIRQVEALAALPEVRFIGPRQEFLLNTGSQTSQGDTAHTAALARSAYSLDGTGVKIGVLSDGVASLAARQLSGDLPATCAPSPGPGACVTVVPGQAGSGDEGTAMLEIVHDLAPEAKLYFATAVNGSASFAQNILDLKNRYGCDIIVDDVTYFDEGAFQDGVIAQAVNTVKAAGALYFSSAGNSGRKDAGTSGTWEGDFFETCWYLGTTSRRLHGFDVQACPSTPPSDLLTGNTGYITLKWSDPLGASANDYDFYLCDNTCSTILDASVVRQNGTQDPYEWLYPATSGNRVVILKYSGATRALRVDTNRGRLSIATARAVVGHNGGDGTISVAATDARVPGVPNPFVGGTTNLVENYSSDGPRRMFYNPNGTAITPGSVTFASGGGVELQKPDITAGDCVTTAFPVGPPLYLSPFCGTSAAAPHAAAIAALLKSAPNNPSVGQALAAMFATALDVNPAGRDRNSGVGIVMANAAAGALINVPAVNFYTVSPCRVFDTRVVAPPVTTGTPLTCGLDYDFTIVNDGVGTECGVPSGAKAVSLNVTVTAPSTQGNVRLFASGTPAPLVSTLNYLAGLTRANNAVAPLSSAGKMAVRCANSGTAHVVVDVNGYFQ